MGCRLLPCVAAMTTFAIVPAISMAQVSSCKDKPPIEVSLSGPRFGVTYLSPGIVRALRDSLNPNYNEKARRLNAVTTQFGFQFERQFAVADCGPSVLTEAVFLVGGLEQGFVIPSGSFLVGLRMPRGAEFGVGPNISPAGAALAVAGGKTIHYGYLDFPVTVAVVPGRSGARISLLTGFIVRRERRERYWSPGLPRTPSPRAQPPRLSRRCVATRGTSRGDSAVLYPKNNVCWP